jgi:hypothetical protein
VRRRAHLFPAACSALLLAGAACGPTPNTVQVTVEAYISAVSLNDMNRMLAMSAPYQRELMAAGTPEAKEDLSRRYRGMIEQGYMMWERAKGTGELAPDPLGVALIRAIGLGKEGAAAWPLGVTFEAGDTRAVLRTRAITNYDRIDWNGLPPGGRMYLLGTPFGKVVNFATGFDDPSPLKLLATVDLRWTLVKIEGLKRPEGAASDWLIEKLEPLPETATSWSPPGGQARPVAP